MDGLRGGYTEFAGEGRLSAHQRYALDERDAMIDRDGYNCWRCGCYLPGQRGARAHRIARTKVNLTEYGPYVLDHRLNIKHSCERCNSYAMHFESWQEREDMVAEIRADLTARGYPIFEYIHVFGTATGRGQGVQVWPEEASSDSGFCWGRHD